VVFRNPPNELLHPSSNPGSNPRFIKISPNLLRAAGIQAGEGRLRTHQSGVS
jgi:hypothetical protein